ncbi:MAG: error-prone DNA polymerase, partial [Chthoniobacterales bacterium]
MTYVELHACSAFSFLRGASFPEQLAERAAELELPAVALLDRNGVYGAQRFSVACREQGVRPIIGSCLTMADGSLLPVLVENRTGYKNLCGLLTEAHLRSEKGTCEVRWEEVAQFREGLIALLCPGSTGRWPVASGGSPGARAQRADGNAFQEPLVRTTSTKDSTPSVRQSLRRATANNRPAACAPQTLKSHAKRLLDLFERDRLYVELQRHFVRGEERLNRTLIDLAEHHRLPLLATNGVQHATAAGREALDVFTCIRVYTHLDAAGTRLTRNAERHLKSGAEMEQLFHDQPDALTNTLRLAERLQFSLENIGYDFPDYPVPEGHSMDTFLRTIVLFGAQQRYAAISRKVKQQLDFELELIIRLGFSGYFLIVWDIVNFCRENDIMVQGRGSAANSAVCYCLGITPVDPVSSNLVFERFLSEGRKGWPDIDLDLPSGDRRERVIQEVYRRYGKHGAAMTANVITYRGRSAAREIGKALNFAPNILDRFSHLFANGDFPHTLDLQAQIEQSGLPRAHPRMPAFVRLYQAIYGLPRHLGQHSGGMIICQGKLSSVVPLENASMPGRVVAQWDKEDCEDLGIVKVDLLGLGMMAVMQDTFTLCRERARPLDLAHLPKDDAATFELMQKADTIGVFQIESRAQMATLPRMKPKEFYDVVIEVAIIRPGPIQGDMVHPYLARRAGKELVTYFDERLKPVLARTLGVPLFQEQMLKIAMIMADFSGAEAEELRRAISFHRSPERMEKVSQKLRAAMERKGVAPEVIVKIIQSISSFALYGFPESHAISFAILAYGSAYLKVHRPAEFYACLLNNQPMGFYAPATIVKDAHRHGIRMRPVCAATSEWRCVVESDEVVRLGFCVVNGLREEHAAELVRQRPFASLADLKKRASLTKEELRTLAELGALNCFAEHRRGALWEVEETLHDDLLGSARASRAVCGASPQTSLGSHL